MKEIVTNIRDKQPTKPLRDFDKGLLLGLTGLSLAGVWLTAYAFIGILPIYQRVRDDVAGGALAQKTSGDQLVWLLFLILLALPVLAAGCASLAIYCIRVWRRG